MSKKEEFTPAEWDSLNAILTEAIAAAYPELSVTPYTPTKGLTVIKHHHALSTAINKRHKNTGSRRSG